MRKLEEAFGPDLRGGKEGEVFRFGNPDVMQQRLPRFAAVAI